MTQEEKQLLLKDICSRLPYKVKIKIRSNDIRTVRAVDMVDGIVHFVESDSISPFGVHIEHPATFRQAVKPYFRPLSSMTEKEQHEYDNLRLDNLALPKVHLYYPMRWHTMDYLHVDWLNAHHFDYRGLIEKGLALEAKEGMYKTE